MVKRILMAVVFISACFSFFPNYYCIASDIQPAVLGSINLSDVSIIDDISAEKISGQAKYVLVMLPKLNSSDSIVGTGASWSANPLSWRYGNWGGAGWSDNKESPKKYDRCGSVVDTMDSYFRKHDNAYADAISLIAAVYYTRIKKADNSLLTDLGTLPNFSDKNWGKIYSSSPAGAPKAVKVANSSLFGNKTYTGYREIPFSEYARRQALTAFSVKRFTVF